MTDEGIGIERHAKVPGPAVSGRVSPVAGNSRRRARPRLPYSPRRTKAARLAGRAMPASYQARTAGLPSSACMAERR